MRIPAIVYAAVVRKHSIPKYISVRIHTRVIAPVVSSKIRTTDYIRSCLSRNVPGVSSAVIASVVRVVKVVVVDFVVRVVNLIFQVDAVDAVRFNDVSCECVAGWPIHVDAGVAVRVHCVSCERVVVAPMIQEDAILAVCAAIVVRKRVVVA